MNHKTLTTLGELRIGDSFVYKLNRQDVWRVMARADKNKRVAVNQVFNGEPLHKYDELKKGSTSVVFLRHTIPVPGEEIFIEDLKEGDVFHNLQDIIHEYVIEQKGHDFWLVRRTDQAAAAGYWGRLTKVIFVRHKI
jgi:hypothetical protein